MTPGAVLSGLGRPTLMPGIAAVATTARLAGCDDRGDSRSENKSAATITSRYRCHVRDDGQQIAANPGGAEDRFRSRKAGKRITLRVEPRMPEGFHT